MERRAPDVTEAELAVLQGLWDRGTATIRQLTEAVYPEGTASQYATVQKLLERLEQKGCVARDRKPWPHVYRPTIDRDDLIGRRLRAVAEQLCGGSLTPLLTHLLKVEHLSARERNELRSFVDDLESKSRPKGGRQ